VQSFVAATSAALHRARGTYSREVSRYLALSEFQRRLMSEGGVPADRIEVVPNFLEPDPGTGPAERRGVVFVGRLSVEKGVSPMLKAAELTPGSVSVIGTGPMADACAAADRRGSLRYLGPLGTADVLSQIRSATALVIPSVWFEGFPMVALEAFATGTPVIASQLGSLEEIVADGITGLTVPPNDPRALADCIRWSVLHPQEMRAMGAAARSVYEAKYRGSAHLRLLRREYELAMGG
jgi:glycosyltransferase involved in cell wall biosynthesis